MKINEQIKKYRKEAGLTQEQIANYLGVSTPAVNKWERGISFPDVTLLPALARLLKVDLDTLFAFHENLTDVEIEAFLRELAMLSENDLDTGFETAAQKIREYPNSDRLLISAANILNARLFLNPMEAEKKKGYEVLILQWLEKAAESEDEEIKNTAISILLGKAMAAGDYDKATALLDRLPGQQFDKTPYEATILIHREKADEAAVLLESKLLQSLSNVQSYCLRLIDVELKCNRPDKAREICEIIEKMIPLFGLWQYGTAVPRLPIALYEKDRQASLAAIKEIMEAANTPWNMADSPLFYRIENKSVRNAWKAFVPALIADLKSGEEYDFMRGDPGFEEFLAGLDEGDVPDKK